MFVVQLARLLRVSAMHRLNNPVMARVGREFQDSANEYFDTVDILSLTLVGEHLYFNGEFVPLIGRSHEAALQIRRIFKKLQVSEISIGDRFENGELFTFLEHVQTALWSKESFVSPAASKNFALRRSSEKGRLDEQIENNEMAARAYVHLATLIREARLIFERGGRVSIPVLRRAVHLLADATAGQEELLLALTRLPNGEGDVSLHSAAVAAFSLLMALKAGVDRATLTGLVISAVFHELGRDHKPHHEIGGKMSSVAFIEAQRRNAWLTATEIGKHMRSAEAVERASVALECTLPARGNEDRMIPSTAAKLISVACAFDSLVQPPPPWTGLRPDQAVSILTSRSDGRFDPAAVALFASVVGVYPVGTIVQLSGGQVAIVVATPAAPDRPTVKVIRDKGLPADYVLELARDDVELDIVQCLDPAEGESNVLHQLFA